MIKDIKELKRLLKLRERSEAQMHVEGFTPEILKNTIEKQKNKIEHEFNGLGWFLIFLIIIPLALMQLGMSQESAIFTSYISGGIIIVILHKITDRSY